MTQAGSEPLGRSTGAGRRNRVSRLLGSAVQFGFDSAMRVDEFAFIGHNAHLIPVIRELLAALEANNIHACQIGGTRARLPPSCASRESRIPVATPEQHVNQDRYDCMYCRQNGSHCKALFTENLHTLNVIGCSLVSDVFQITLNGIKR